MPLIKYQDVKFKADTLVTIGRANEIVTEYAAQGFDLTLRQLYYQFVSRDWLQNTQQEYKRLGSIVADGRLAGLIDWDAITDRTRNLAALSHWDSPSSIVDAVAEQFRYDKWADQRVRPEVWIEKDALVGVIEGVCKQLDVAYFSCRGYTSLSEVWGAGQRFRGYLRQKQTPVVLHLGDHDPSGIDMSRDIRDRLKLFTGRAVEVRRLALNMDQVRQYDPPPNPAKLGDSRSPGYVAAYGDESWELDALSPPVLAALIREAVIDLRDPDKWRDATTRENKAKRELAGIANNYTEVQTFLEDSDMLAVGMDPAEDDDEPDED